MSRAEFYRSLIASKDIGGDRLNSNIIKHIVPEMLSDIRDLQVLNIKALPEMADDIFIVANKNIKVEKDLSSLEKITNNRLTVLQDALDRLESVKIKDLESSAEHNKNELTIINKNIIAITESINKLNNQIGFNTIDISKLKSRKVVFTLENTSEETANGPGLSTDVRGED